MNNSSRLRNFNRIGSNISKFFECFKWEIILFCIIWCVGFIVGIIMGTKIGGDLEIERMSNTYIVAFINIELSYWNLIGIELLYVIAIFLLSFVFNKMFAFQIINFILTILFAYLFGFDLVVAFVSFSLFSKICFILFYILIGVLIYFISCVMLGIGFKIYKSNRKYGRFCFGEGNDLFIIMMLLCVIMIILLLVQALLLSFVHFVYIG